MAQTHPLQELYDREINFKVETSWGGGFDVALVDPMNGYMAGANTKTFDDAVHWLVEHADNHRDSMEQKESFGREAKLRLVRLPSAGPRARQD